MRDKVKVSDIYTTVEAIFCTAGLSQKQAQELTEQLMYSEQRGITSHGLIRIQWILNQLKKYPNPSPKKLMNNSVVALYDAKDVLGYLALNEVVTHQPNAHNQKVKMIGIRNTYPTGALSYFAEKLADKGWIVLMSSTSPRRVGMRGDKQAIVGTNPWTFAVPVKSNNGGYAVADASLAELTHGQCLKLLARGEHIPAKAASLSGGGEIRMSSDLWQGDQWNAVIHTIGDEQAYKSFTVMWSLHLMGSRMLGMNGDDQHGTFMVLLSPYMWAPFISHEEVIAGLQEEIALLESSDIAHVPGSGRTARYNSNQATITLSDDVAKILEKNKPAGINDWFSVA